MQTSESVRSDVGYCIWMKLQCQSFPETVLTLGSVTWKKFELLNTLTQKRPPEAIFLRLSDIAFPACCKCLYLCALVSPANESGTTPWQYYCLSCADLTFRNAGKSMQLRPLINNVIDVWVQKNRMMWSRQVEVWSSAEFVVSQKRLRHQPSTHLPVMIFVHGCVFP